MQGKYEGHFSLAQLSRCSMRSLSTSSTAQVLFEEAFSCSGAERGSLSQRTRFSTRVNFRYLIGAFFMRTHSACSFGQVQKEGHRPLAQHYRCNIVGSVCSASSALQVQQKALSSSSPMQVQYEGTFSSFLGPGTAIPVSLSSIIQLSRCSIRATV